ncbi:MAG: ABC-2 family transporter protein [Polyangia bacterium]
MPGRLDRALPAMLRVGWKDALAYRGEFLVWMLTMTLPLVMLALFRAVAAEGSLGGFDASAFTAYFLAGLCVRQLASSWSIWEINREIREGALSMRLLRPIHPLWSYLCDSLAAIPMRAAISLPVALVLLYSIDGTAGEKLARDPVTLALFGVSLAQAFGIIFSISSTIGALGLYLESALGLWNIYVAFFMLLSGYLLPLALFPAWLQRVAALTPFPYLQSLPIEILVRRLPLTTMLRGLAIQSGWLVLSVSVLLLVWQRAQKRFAAYGG